MYVDYSINRCFVFSVSLSDVLSPKALIPSIAIGTPLAVLAGSVAAVALGILGTSLLVCSIFDPTIYQGAKESLRLAGYGVALAAIGLANPILLGAPVAFIALSLTYDVGIWFQEEKALPDEGSWRL